MLKKDIQADVTRALKSGDAEVAGVLRLALAAISAKEKEQRYKLSKEEPQLFGETLEQKSALSDEEAVSVLSLEIKKRRDAIALYEQGNRPELAQREMREIGILQKYLPAQLSGEEIKKLVEETLAATGAEEIKDMGRVMAALSPKIKGKADPGEVGKMVKDLLQKK